MNAFADPHSVRTLRKPSATMLCNASDHVIVMNSIYGLCYNLACLTVPHEYSSSSPSVTESAAATVLHPYPVVGLDCII